MPFVTYRFITFSRTLQFLFPGPICDLFGGVNLKSAASVLPTLKSSNIPLNFLPSMNYRNYEMILKNVQTPPYPKLPAEFLTSATSDQHHFPPPVFGRFTRVSSAPLNVFSSIALSRDCPCTLNLRLLLLLASLSGLLTPAVGVCSGLFFSSPSSSSSSN